MDIVKLKTELTAGHPNTGAYDTDDALAATQLNVVNRSKNLASLTGSEVMNAIVKTDFDGLSDTNKQQVWNILHLGTINPFGIEADMMIGIFGGGSATITALKTIRKVSVSRAGELGHGVIREGHVREARG